MAPRVQTFAWRLLRRATPSGKRAGRFSHHIEKTRSRCNVEEDDMHLFFLCPFAKAVWFHHRWYLRSECIAQKAMTISDVIQNLLSSGHPMASLQNIMIFFGAFGNLGMTNDLTGKMGPHPKFSLRHWTL